ncbi:MAG: polyprenyl synthetase family protein [Planctomycetes bacterium]|nr:polyprenyl synthetase family protein [Planctomycetota bacterium]
MALLAGGRSRRMGQDKARLAWGGEPLVRLAMEAALAPLDDGACEALLCAGDLERGEMLLPLCAPAARALPLRAVADAAPFGGCGPLAGILAALEAARGAWVLATACDRPAIAPALLRHLVALARSAPAGTEAVVPASPRGLEPLLALYHRCAGERLRETLAAGRFAIVDFLRGGRILVCDPEIVASFDPELRSFGNLNTPDDLERQRSGALATPPDSPPVAGPPLAAAPRAGEPARSPMEREREEILKPVAAALRGVPARIRAALAAREASVQTMLEHLSRYEGKLLRPALVLLTAGAVRERSSPRGGVLRADDLGEVLEVAAIVEMVHVATLVHDDVIDEAEKRRRVPSINARFGNHEAVLLGDYMYARAFHLATLLASPICARVLSEVTRELCEGQIAELAACRDFGLGEEGYLRIAQGKTASLYGAACRLGASYAGADDAVASALERFGRDLGLGFQIVDDCLDLSGSEEIVGKSLGTDLHEGKITLPLLLAYERADAGGRRRIEQMYAAPAAESARHLAELRAELDLGGAVDAALRRADHFLRRATAELEVLPDGPYRASLLRLPEYILCREW